jgi:hypothetical protein
MNVKSVERPENNVGVDRFHLLQLGLTIAGIAIMYYSSSNFVFSLGFILMAAGLAPILNALIIAFFVSIIAKPIIDGMPLDTEFKVMRAKRNAENLKEEVQQD